MIKFLANFLIARSITINDRSCVLMPLAFRAGLFTDLITLHCALHGFSDASTAAFTIAVYLSIINIDDSITIFFLAAKSKVAPLKTIRVPRLELSAALFLARLMHFARSALQLLNLEYHCWTESTIIFAWLSQSPSRWKTFVANRIRLCNHSFPEFHGVMFRRTPIPRNVVSRFRSRSFPDTCSMVFRPSMVALSSQILAELVPFGTLRCSSRITLRIFSMCLARYAQLGFRIALFFVAKIVMNLLLSISFSKSTPML